MEGRKDGRRAGGRMERGKKGGKEGEREGRKGKGREKRVRVAWGHAVQHCWLRKSTNCMRAACMLPSVALNPGTWMGLPGRRDPFLCFAQNFSARQAVCPQSLFHLRTSTFQHCAQLLLLDWLWPWLFRLVDFVNLKGGTVSLKCFPNFNATMKELGVL